MTLATIRASLRDIELFPIAFWGLAYARPLFLVQYPSERTSHPQLLKILSSASEGHVETLREELEGCSQLCAVLYNSLANARALHQAVSQYQRRDCSHVNCVNLPIKAKRK